MNAGQILGIAIIVMSLSATSHAEKLITIGLLDLSPLTYKDANQNITGVLSEITDKYIGTGWNK